MITALGRARESLRASALVFQWSLGHRQIENELGIGYTGLAAALDRMDTRACVVFKASEHGSQQPPLPPLPRAERPSSMNEEPLSPGLPPDLRQYDGHNGNTASSINSNERYPSGTTKTFDRMSAFDESHETRSHHTTLSDSGATLEALVGLDLNATKVTRLKADPFSMPRWSPRNTAGGDAANLKTALICAVRGKNHERIEQLLNQGVSPNTGPEHLALKEAVANSDAEAVRLLLLFGADPNGTD